ncbi:MAG TPA: hypothetical protein VM324_04250 [Egibacteraceae bacterium]|nr:hypothetical protein [Egibacteraceae bacterium]
MSRSLRAALLVVFTVAAGALAPAAAMTAPRVPDGSVGIRLLDAPADRRDDARAHAYIVDHVAPGTRIERRIEVGNGTAGPARVELYTAGAAVEGGAFTFSPGRERNELAEWTRVDPPAVTVPARGTAEATVRIDVPANAAAGERYAVVWAEPPAATDGDVAVVNRVGIRIYLSVGPGGEPASDFAIGTLTARRTAAAVPEVLAEVVNTGGRALDLTGELTLSDGPGGLSAGPVPAGLGTTLGVGQSADVRFVLDPALPDGPWRAELTLRSGSVVRTAAATVEFPPPGATLPATPLSGARGWPAVVALALLVAVAALALVSWRLRRSATPAAGA